MKKLLSTMILSQSTLFAGIAFSADKTSPSLFLNMGGGLLTHKSKLVTSNDTSTSVNYSFGISGGNNNSMSFLINNYTSTTVFELNSSSITSAFQDTTIRVFWGMLYLGATFSQSSFIITATGETEIDIDAIGTGMGGNIGVEYDFGRSKMIFLDILFASTTTVKEVNSTDFEIGPRTEISIGGKFPITRTLMNAQVGYTQRTYTLSYSGTSYAELNSITWLGLGFNWYF